GQTASNKKQRRKHQNHDETEQGCRTVEGSSFEINGHRPNQYTSLMPIPPPNLKEESFPPMKKAALRRPCSPVPGSGSEPFLQQRLQPLHCHGNNRRLGVGNVAILSGAKLICHLRTHAAHDECGNQVIE